VALDWTPNINHTGFYVARAAGYYDDAGLDVTLRSPAEDGYETTPAERVATGASTLAVAPSESAISYHTHPEYDSLTAVAAICQRDPSAVVALADDDVDGRTYASYDARFEDDIVRRLVRADGGAGDVEFVTPPKLGIRETVVEGDADATWVSVPWEGPLAEREGLDLTPFSLDDYDIPYGYTPVLLARPERVAGDATALSAFLDATRRGYEFAAEEPAAAAERLADGAEGPHLDDHEFLAESQRRLADALLDGNGRWGAMEESRWSSFVEWLAADGVLRSVGGEPLDASAVDVDALYTDELL
jgi:NitT/TauT family transport system substrate-binding protein